MIRLFEVQARMLANCRQNGFHFYGQFAFGVEKIDARQKELVGLYERFVLHHEHSKRL